MRGPPTPISATFFGSLFGRAAPRTLAGDLYVMLEIVAPPAGTDEARAAYRALAKAYAGPDPRATLEKP